MALAPLTSADTSESHSFDGDTYSIAKDTTPASSAETPYLLLINPPTTATNLNILSVVLSAISHVTSPTGVQTVVRLYGDPSVTSNGSVQTINKQKLGSAIPTLMQSYSGPTVTSNGNLIDVWAVSSMGEATEDDHIDYSLIVQPGHSILITVQGTVNGPSEIAVIVEWSEF